MSGGFGPMMMGAGDAEGAGGGQKLPRGAEPRMAQLPEDVRAKMTEVQKLHMQMRLVRFLGRISTRLRSCEEDARQRLARWQFDQMVKFRDAGRCEELARRSILLASGVFLYV